ncbi:MAG: hypothetical protein U1E62_09300 [Alsobacter sp.]
MRRKTIQFTAGLATLAIAVTLADHVADPLAGCPGAGDRLARLDQNMKSFSAVRSDPQGVCRLLRERLALEEQGEACPALAPPHRRNDFAVPFLRRAITERCA